MSIRGVICAFGLSLGLAACTALPGGARIEGYSGPAQQFDGLTTPIARGPLRAQGVHYIFHIHGMGLTGRQGFHDALYELLLRRGFSPVGPDAPWTPAMLPAPLDVTAEGLDCSKPWVDHLHPNDQPLPNPCHFASFGEYKVDRLKNAAGEEIRLYSYFWHRDLWRIQEPMLRRDMQRHAGKPAYLDSSLKHDIVDGGLSDAAAYVGASGPLVRAGIESVLCTMSRDAVGLPAAQGPQGRTLTDCDDERTGARFQQPDAAAFDFVSHSLGSRMLFDVLAPPGASTEAAQSTDPSTARGMLVGRARTVFMAANQLPLLALGTVRLHGADRSGDLSASMPASSSDRCAATLSLLRARCRIDQQRNESRELRSAISEGPLQVVGFVDPDDLLGFHANDTLANTPGFFDITHRNATQWLWLFVLPNVAHDHELQSRDTQSMILCGARISDKGAVTPRPCS